MRLRLATLCAAVFVSATTTAVLMSAIDVYAMGHVDDKWGGPRDNFWLGVTIYGDLGASADNSHRGRTWVVNLAIS
jgi:hypothetical protein